MVGRNPLAKDRMMEVIVSEPVYLADGRINCTVDFGNGPMPYTSGVDDDAPWGAAIFDAATKLEPVPYVEPVPDPVADLDAERAVMSATRYQIKAVILEKALLPAVTAAIAKADALTQIQWADMASFSRNAAPMPAIAAALGLTDEQLDEVFRTALEY